MKDKLDGGGAKSAVVLEHFAQGVATYGIETYNKPSAATALVIHQYSQKSGHAAVWVDNCGSEPAVKIVNTENASNAPGQFGSGRFLDLKRRPATGQAVEDCYYISGEGVMCAVPKAATPSVLADGMMWCEGVGAAMHVYARLNGVTRQLDN